MEKRVFLGVGVSLALVVGALSAPAVNADESTSWRYIDAGNTRAPIVQADKTWEPQLGFKGGTIGSVDDAPSTGVKRKVAKTVLIDPDGFSLAVPNGNYRVVLWAYVPSSDVSYSVEGGQRSIPKGSTDRARIKSFSSRARISDGALDLTFASTNGNLKIAALVIAGRRSSSTSSTTSTLPSTTVTTVRPSTSSTVMDHSGHMPSPTPDTSPVTIAPVRDDRSVDDSRGEWQMMCDMTHQAKDDPIVFPGAPGAAHMHSFYGNRTTNASSTSDSLMAGGSSCGRGMESSDRSAYWVPSLMKDVNGSATPEAGGDQIVWAYYRRAGGPGGPQVQPFPTGLRMITGDARATSPQAKTIAQWQCGFGGPTYSNIPTCQGDEIHSTILFPSCWNGKDLDSPNHKSHMAFAAYDGTCPAAYPVSLPELWLEVDYLGITDGSKYTLASGGVYSMHADFFAAWDPQVQRALIAGCLNQVHACEGITREGNELVVPEGNVPTIDIGKY